MWKPLDPLSAKTGEADNAIMFLVLKLKIWQTLMHPSGGVVFYSQDFVVALNANKEPQNGCAGYQL